MMRSETEVETLLKEIVGIIDDGTDEKLKRRIDLKRMAGSGAMVCVLEWALGAQGDKTRKALVKLVKTELADAVRRANK
jgi:hypothetical protein